MSCFALALLLLCGIAYRDSFADAADPLMPGATAGQPSAAADSSGTIASGANGAGIHDLAGYGLNMTLADFKIMPLIDRTRFPKARVLCSGDGELQQSTSMGDMRPMPDEARVGMIRCNVFHPDPVNVSWWAPLLPSIAGQPGKAAAYYFLPAGHAANGSAATDGGYRLLFSQYQLPSTVLEQVRDRLTSQFGEPAHLKAGVDGLNHIAWTDYWQLKDVWVLLDSKDKAHKFTVSYIAPTIAESPAGRRFDATGDPLYYSMFRHIR